LKAPLQVASAVLSPFDPVLGRQLHAGSPILKGLILAAYCLVVT